MNVREIRKDFPMYCKDDPPIYLDSACQALRPKAVIDAVREYYDDFAVCSGRSVYSLSMGVQARCEEVREKAAKFIGSKDSREIIFTRNTTEGINTVLFGKNWEHGDEIICTDHEHNSVHVPLLRLAERFGVKILRARSQGDESLDIEHLKSLVGANTRLVITCHSSNVTGYTIPAKEVSEIAHDAGAEFMLDAAQSVPHQKVDVEALGADYLAFSVHKMCGPSGMGVLFGKFELLTELEPLMLGGMTVGDSNIGRASLLDPPQRFEAGLQNYSGIFGSGAAIDYISRIGMENIREHEISLSRRLQEKVAAIGSLEVISCKDPTARGGIFSFNVSEMDSHDVAISFEAEHGILIRSGYHCCHSWFHARNINGCARASTYIYNDARDIDALADAIIEISEEAG
ncbi:MAG: cysteine desulfurase [Thermoplasmata archaeon]